MGIDLGHIIGVDKVSKSFISNFISGALESLISDDVNTEAKNIDDYKVDGSNMTNDKFVDHGGNECTEFFGDVINKATGEKVN